MACGSAAPLRMLVQALRLASHKQLASVPKLALVQRSSLRVQLGRRNSQRVLRKVRPVLRKIRLVRRVLRKMRQVLRT